MQRAGRSFGCGGVLSCSYGRRARHGRSVYHRRSAYHCRGAAQARGHDVFKRDFEAGADAAHSEITACGTCTDDRDVAQRAEGLHGWAVILR